MHSLYFKIEILLLCVEPRGYKSKQDGQCMYNAILRRVRVNIFGMEEQYVLHIEIVFVALVIGHAKRMRGIALPCVGCLSVAYFFSTSSHKHYYFRTDLISDKMGLDYLYNFVSNISHFKRNSARCHECT